MVNWVDCGGEVTVVQKAGQFWGVCISQESSVFNSQKQENLIRWFLTEILTFLDAIVKLASVR